VRGSDWLGDETRTESLAIKSLLKGDDNDEKDFHLSPLKNGLFALNKPKE